MKRTVISLLMVIAMAAPAVEAKPTAKAKPKAVKTSVKGKAVKATAKPKVVKGKAVKAKAVKAKAVKGKAAKPKAVKLSAKQKKQATQARLKGRVPASMAPIFVEAGDRYKLDPLLIAAVARQESRFRPRVVSPVGARGVMQLMPRTARALGVKDSFDPRQNIFGGAKYLRQLLNQFRGDVNLSLAAYNAGPGAVKKYRGIPPYRETRNYVAAIRRDYDRTRVN